MAAKQKKAKPVYTLLNSDERAQAASQGWQLVHVVDSKTRKVAVEAHPVGEFTKPFDTQRKVFTWVYERAKARDTLAIKALTLINTL